MNSTITRYWYDSYDSRNSLIGLYNEWEWKINQMSNVLDIQMIYNSVANMAMNKVLSLKWTLLTLLCDFRHTLRETWFSQTWQRAKINNLSSECRQNRKKSKTRTRPSSTHSQGYQRMTCWNFNCPNASCGLETKSNQDGSSFLVDTHPKESSIFD